VSFHIVQDGLVKMLAEVTAMQLYCLRLVGSSRRAGLPTPLPRWGRSIPVTAGPRHKLVRRVGFPLYRPVSR